MLRTWIAACCLTALAFAPADPALAASPSPTGPTVSATELADGDLAFAPPTITIFTGQSITFVNTGQVPHTAVVTPSPTSSPDYTSPGIPVPSATPEPPTQKYLPPIGGGLLVILLGGIGVGYLRLRRSRDD